MEFVMNRRLSTFFATILATLSAFTIDARPALKRPAFQMLRNFAQRTFPQLQRSSFPTAQRFSHWRSNNSGRNERNRSNWNNWHNKNSEKMHGAWKSSALSGLFASVILNNDRKQQTSAVAFTKDNVATYRGHNEFEQFVAYALEHITTKDVQEIAAIVTLIEEHSGQYKQAAHKLTDVAVKNFAAVDEKILQAILKYNPQAAESFAKVAIETDNSHFSDIAKNPKKWAYNLGVSTTYDLNLTQGTLINEIVAAIKEQKVYFGKITYEKLESLKPHYTLNDAQKTQLVLSLLDNPNLKKIIWSMPAEAYYQAVKPENIHKIHILNIPEFSYEMTDEQKKQLILKHLYNPALSTVPFYYNNINLSRNKTIADCLINKNISPTIIQEALKAENIKKVPLENFEMLIPYTTREELNQITNEVKKRVSPNTPPMQAILSGTRAAHISCIDPSHTATQSDHHVCNHKKEVYEMLKKYPSSETLDIRNLFKQIHAKEKEENNKSNYTFLHSRIWEWDFVSDMYKHIHNLNEQPQDRIGDDYVPLRFDSSKGEYASEEHDMLFLNPALFSNTQYLGNSTIQSFLRGLDWSAGKSAQFSPQTFFKKHNLFCYSNYEKEFADLKQLHTQANPKKYGSMLMLSINDKNLQYVHSVGNASEIQPVYIDGQKVTDIHQIMKSYKENPSKLKGNPDRLGHLQPADSLQFGLILNKHTLNHKTGPRIYSFNAADPKLYQEYCAKRDELFAKIAQEMEQDKTNKTNSA